MNGSITANLERSARTWPHRCAIQCGSERVTYAELWERSLAVAGFLQQRGLTRGDRVALALTNSPEWVEACYGVLLAGGIAVLLNAAARARDFEVWLRHSGARWLICDTASPDIVAAVQSLDTPPRVVLTANVTDSQLNVESSFSEILRAGARPQHHDLPDTAAPAVIIYTSGTTGNAKGVLLSHGNLASNSAAIVEYLGLTHEDSMVTVLPFYYSYGSSVLHTHLQVGGRLVIEQNLVYPHRVVETLAQENATGFAGVPSTFALLLSRVDLSQYGLTSLKYLTQAGGAMPVPVIRKLQRALPAARIFVMYGQTEATARLTYLPPEKLDAKVGSAGVPISGVRIEVRLEEGAKAPAGEIGEVWAQGPNVMLGYWENPEASAQVLRDGWLRTGDMGYLDDEGFLFLSGRRSDMIKTGAHRVHPADIEEVIHEMEDVVEAAVVGIPDEIMGQAVKALVVARAGSGLSDNKVKAHCRHRLAVYKVPKLVEFVTELPRTASGKVRRQQLVAAGDSFNKRIAEESL